MLRLYSKERWLHVGCSCSILEATVVAYLLRVGTMPSASLAPNATNHVSQFLLILGVFYSIVVISQNRQAFD